MFAISASISLRNSTGDLKKNGKGSTWKNEKPTKFSEHRPFAHNCDMERDIFTFDNLYMKKKEARENANFTNFGYFETMLPVMTEESRKKNIDILNKAERPKYLLDHEVPENFNLLNFGQYSDLCDAMGGNNDVDMLKAIVKAVYPDATDEQIEAESVFKVFGFCNFAAREIDRINKLFGSIEVECSDEERRAGIGKVQFGTFGILDWYAKRMGIIDQNEVNSVAWVRIYTCMKNDSAEVAFQRRLQKIYNQKTSKGSKH